MQSETTPADGPPANAPFQSARRRTRNRWIATSAVAASVVLIAAFLLTRSRDADESRDAAAPRPSVRQRIETLFDAAQSSDVDRYLDCFAEPLRSRVKERLEGDAAALAQSEKELTSFDCPPDVDAVQGDEAVFVVVKIYPETNERVRFRLKRVDGQWKIAAMQPLDRNAPETKYGTPVFRVR